MNKLTLLAKEYLAIARHLQTTGHYCADATAGTLFVPKPTVVQLLNKNPYIPATDKLTHWRSLGWLDCDTDRLTKRRYIGGCYQRVLVLNLQVVPVLATLLESSEPLKTASK